jgi:hypothetical protein
MDDTQKPAEVVKAAKAAISAEEMACRRTHVRIATAENRMKELSLSTLLCKKFSMPTFAETLKPVISSPLTKARPIFSAASTFDIAKG